MKQFPFFKKDRLKRKEDFKRIFDKGSLYKSKFYYLYYIKNNLDYPRIGIIIKKYIGNSVIRNYEKRIIREFFRIYKTKLNNKNFDFIILLKKKEIDYIDKREDFINIIDKLNNLCLF